MSVTPAPFSLPTGVPVKLNGATPLTAPADLIFACSADPGGTDFSVAFQDVGTLTTLTASLQISLDGGTTWTDLVASGSFLTTAAPAKIVTPLVSGALYRIHATALTGSQDFWACSN